MSSSLLQTKTQPKQCKKPQTLFTRDKKVEVKSDEEGFKGVWYESTIIETPMSKYNKQKGKVLIKYNTLLADGGVSPLKEYVCPTFVRPLPPKEVENERVSFDVYDVVDAYYLDGWWKGVVSDVREVNGEKKYLVVFDTPPDQMELCSEELRAHWDWNGEEWTKAPKQLRMKGLEFSKGMTVEVNLCKYIWFQAVILEETGFNSFWVKINRPGNNNESEKKVLVDSFHIRPPQPFIKTKVFELLDKVCVFHGSARKEGFITNILTDGSYVVYLKGEKKTKKFHESKLMLYLQLVDGKWTGRHCKDGLLISSCQGQSDYIVNNKERSPTVTLKLDSVSSEHTQVLEQSPCTNSCTNLLNYSITSNSKFKKARSKRCRREAKNTWPCKKFKGEKSVELSSFSECHEKSTPPTPLEQSNGENSTFVLSKCSSNPVAENRASVESTIPVSRKETHEEEAVMEDNMMAFAEKSEAPLNSELEGQQVLASGKRVNTNNVCSETFASPPSIDHMETDYVLNICGTELMQGICDDMMFSEEKSGAPENSEHKGEEDNSKGVLEEVLTPQLSTGCMAEEVNIVDLGTNCVVKSGGMLMDDECLILCSEETSAELVTKHGMEKMVTNYVAVECTSESCGTSNVDQRSLVLCLEGGKNDRKKESAGTSTPLSATDCMTEEAEIVDMATNWVENSNGASSVHQPQFLFFEGHSPCNTQNQCTYTIDGESVPGTESPVRNVEVNDEPVENVEMPFVKNPHLWKFVDSLEIFKLMPQQPHFRPLMNVREPLREGLAMGFAVTFSSVVEKISTLEVTDPENKFNNCLEALAELELHGFRVKPAVDRVNKLLSIKDERRQFEDQSKEIKAQLAELTCEGVRLNASILGYDKLLRELREEKGLHVLLLKNCNRDITNLQRDDSAVDEGISCAIRDFENLVTASW